MRLLLVVSTIALASPVFADPTPLPDIDVDALCEESARMVNGGNSQKLYCLKTEQIGYDELKVKWPKASEEVRKVCVGKWRHYSMISYCIDEEQRASEDVAKYKFKK